MSACMPGSHALGIAVLSLRFSAQLIDIHSANIQGIYSTKVLVLGTEINKTQSRSTESARQLMKEREVKHKSLKYVVSVCVVYGSAEGGRTKDSGEYITEELALGSSEEVGRQTRALQKDR